MLEPHLGDQQVDLRVDALELRGNQFAFESGAPLNAWRSVDIDLKSEFRRHFADGDMNADVPAFVGVGIMTDGDPTQTESSPDYGTFFVAG